MPPKDVSCRQPFFPGLHLVTNFHFSCCHTIAGKELTPEEKAFKAKQAADKKAAAAYLKGKGKKKWGNLVMAAFGVFILALTQTNADIHKETLSYRFFFSVHSQVQNVSENVDKLPQDQS